jgi:soluble lytic murein transglycosylase-like protein
MTLIADDEVTDQFLQGFRPLREDAARRHALAGEITTAATAHGLDPDLLFALVAVESRFNSTAVSRKGARGLGQLMFPTARAVAPTLVHRPGDLYSVRRNLTVTARHLSELLTEQDGDLRAALTAYHLGRHAGHRARREEDRYVGLVCTHYASLKVKRGYEAMTTAGRANAGSAES